MCPGMSMRRNAPSAESLAIVILSDETKYRFHCGNTIVCSHVDPVRFPGAAVRYFHCVFTPTKSFPLIATGDSAFACVQICGPSIDRLAVLPWYELSN